MNLWREAGGAVGISIAAALDAVPAWAGVLVVLVVTCGPELRRWVELLNSIAWQWDSRRPSRPRPQVARPSSHRSGLGARRRRRRVERQDS